MASPDDPYVLPNGTLRNTLGLTDAGKLMSAEVDLAGVREWILRASLPRPPFTFDTLKTIHRTLFQDIYSWAGEPRTVPLSKREFDRPDSPALTFAPPEEIAARSEAVFRRLAERNFFANASRSSFAESAADFLSDINAAHPFREGNGRAQRVMLEAIAQHAGHHLAFDVVTRERMAAVSAAGQKGDRSGVRRMIEKILDPGQVGAMRRALDYLHDRTSVPWNDVYIAATSGGRSYNGTLVARSGDDFMLRTAEGTSPRLHVGDMRELPTWAVIGDRIRFEANRFTATQSVLDLTPSRQPSSAPIGGASSSEQRTKRDQFRGPVGPGRGG
jgi:cell filamentation protein, protein adenylyltransferase